MHSVDELFALWSADIELARTLGVPYTTVSAWKHRGSIPVAYWRDIVQAARRRGHPEVTADLLVELHARKSASQLHNGFAEESDASPIPDQAQAGHFSRWKHVRRGHFASREQIAGHVGALREEWDHR